VGVDVADGSGGDLRIGQSHAHGSRGSGGEWLGQMMRVGGDAEAGDFSPHFSAAGLGSHQRFHYGYRCAFAEDGPLRIARKPPAGVGRKDSLGFP
jgi:hypothetical protein